MTQPQMLSTVAPTPPGPGCEQIHEEGFLAEPVSAITSLAFVAAAIVIVILVRRPETGQPARGVVGYALLVAGVGAGSVVQHGPNPPWADLAHDLPIVAVLALLAADSVADLVGRPRAQWWWVVPTAALVPVIVLAPRPADLVQAAFAAITVALMVARAWARPGLRPRLAAALGVLASGAALGSLSRAGGPLCDPASPWQGHAAWHLLAATALVLVAPVVGAGPGTRTPAAR